MATAQNTQHLSSTAQQYLDIVDITNDLLILKDGSAAMVMELSAINFGLLSEPEQDAIIYAYAALINSLSFPVQIVISSRPKDVSLYLEYIDEQHAQATTDMRRQQIASYRQFVANLITEQNVLDKNFFVVISISSLEVGVTSAGGILSMFMPSAAPAPKIDKNLVVEKAHNILGPRRDHLINQFARFGLRAQQLTTKELIHEFYVLYNGQAAEGAKIVDTKEYTTSIIQAYGAQNQAPLTAPLPGTPGTQLPAAPVAPTAPVAPAALPVQSVPTAMPTMAAPAASITSAPPATAPSEVATSLPSAGTSAQLQATPVPGPSASQPAASQPARPTAVAPQPAPSPQPAPAARPAAPSPSALGAAVAAIPQEGPTMNTTQPR